MTTPQQDESPLLPLAALLAGAISLVACDSKAAEAPPAAGTESAEPSRPGEGLVFLADPENVTEKAPMRSDGTYEPRPYFHDFGDVADGERPSYVFRLRNTDPEPVAIRKVTPSCGCTVPSLRYVGADGEVVRGRAVSVADRPLLVVPPDHVLEVEVRIDTDEIKTKNADKLMTVTISTDSPNSYYLQLEAHIVVEAPFNVVPMSLDMGRIPRSAGGASSVDIVPALGFRRRVTGVASAPDDLHCEITYENVLGNDKWTLHTTFEPGLALGRQSREVLVATETEEGEPSTPIRVPVVAYVTEDIQFEPARFVFRAASDERFSVRMRSLLQGHRFRILSATLPEEHREELAVSFVEEDEVKDGVSASFLLGLRVVGFREAAEYPLRGEVRLRLDDPQHEEVSVGYVIHAPEE